MSNECKFFEGFFYEDFSLYISGTEHPAEDNPDLYYLGDLTGQRTQTFNITYTKPLTGQRTQTFNITYTKPLTGQRTQTFNITYTKPLTTTGHVITLALAEIIESL